MSRSVLTPLSGSERLFVCKLMLYIYICVTVDPADKNEVWECFSNVCLSYENVISLNIQNVYFLNVLKMFFCYVSIKGTFNLKTR